MILEMIETVTFFSQEVKLERVAALDPSEIDKLSV